MHTANTIPQKNTKSWFSKQKFSKKSAVLLSGVSFVAAMITIAHFTIDLTDFIKSDHQLKVEQHQKFVASNQKVAQLLWAWNGVESMKDTSKENVKTIKRDIPDLIRDYPLLNTKRLSIYTQLVQKWHTVKLYNTYIDVLFSINKDKKNAIAYSVKAMQLLDEVDNILADAKVLSAQDKEYLKKEQFRERVKQTRLVSMAFSKILLPDDGLNNKAMETLLDNMGGCEKASSWDMKHNDLITALGCTEYFKTVSVK